MDRSGSCRRRHDPGHCPADRLKPSPGPNGFKPSPWLPGADLQTIVPSLWPGPHRASPPEHDLFEVEADNRVGIEVEWPPGRPRGTLLLIHGMGGSARSAYLLHLATYATASGWAVLRMNLRNCGGTARHASTLYNAGQSQDVGSVLEAIEDRDDLPRPFAVAGFSMGGNIALRYAGIAGSECRADAVVGINPPVDLELCLQALERPRNLFYHLYYTNKLCRQLRGIRRIRELPGPPALARKIRTLRNFDRQFTAPDAGYASPEDYYANASAGPHLGSIRRPAMVVSAVNDPFVPVEMFEPHHGSARIRFRHPSSGGHCGYWQSGTPRFWIGGVLLNFFADLPES